MPVVVSVALVHFLSHPAEWVTVFKARIEKTKEKQNLHFQSARQKFCNPAHGSDEEKRGSWLTFAHGGIIISIKSLCIWIGRAHCDSLSLGDVAYEKIVLVGIQDELSDDFTSFDGSFHFL